MMISDNDKCSLLRMAFQRIENHLLAGYSEEVPGHEISEVLSERCGAFVSLYINDELRGCIGTFAENEKLYNNVRNMAHAAAASDSRFSPIEASELDLLKIEISVLTPRKRIFSPDEILIGTHGIYIKEGSQRGTLLPQVAINQNWNVKQFLGNCSKYKAGLGWDGWRSAELYTYEAFVFSSDDTPGFVKKS